MSKRKLLLIIITIISVVAGGSYLFLNKNNNRQVTIFMDGWSYRTLGNETLRFNGKEIHFKAGNTKTYENLVTRDNESAKNIVARMFLPNPELKCDKDGCSAGSIKIATDSIINPKKAEQYKDIYNDWNIEKGIYTAKVNVNKDQTAIQIGTPNGLMWVYPKNDKVTIGYAMGTAFNLDMIWLRDSNIRFTNIRPDNVHGYSGAGDVQPLMVPAKGGLGVVIPASSTATNAQLTIWSSPTTGCGGLALCVPDDSSKTANIKIRTTESKYVCMKGAGDGLLASEVKADSKLRLRALIVDYTSEYKEQKSIAQMGIWNGQYPDGSSVRSVYINGNSPTVKAFVGHYRGYTLYYDNGQVYGINGEIYQVGIDQDNTNKIDMSLLERDGIIECN